MQALWLQTRILSFRHDLPQPVLQNGEALVRVCLVAFERAAQPGVLKILLQPPDG